MSTLPAETVFLFCKSSLTIHLVHTRVVKDNIDKKTKISFSSKDSGTLRGCRKIFFIHLSADDGYAEVKPELRTLSQVRNVELLRQLFLWKDWGKIFRKGGLSERLAIAGGR